MNWNLAEPLNVLARADAAGGALGCSERALEEEGALRTLPGVLLPAGCSPRQRVPSGPRGRTEPGTRAEWMRIWERCSQGTTDNETRWIYLWVLSWPCISERPQRTALLCGCVGWESNILFYGSADLPVLKGRYSISRQGHISSLKSR